MGLMDLFKEKDAFEGLWARQVNDKLFLINIKKEKAYFNVNFSLCWYEKTSEKLDGSENGRSKAVFNYKLKEAEIGTLFFDLNDNVLCVAGLPILMEIDKEKSVIMLKDSNTVFNYVKQKNSDDALFGLQTLIKQEILASGMYKLKKDITAEDNPYIKILHNIKFSD